MDEQLLALDNASCLYANIAIESSLIILESYGSNSQKLSAELIKCKLFLSSLCSGLWLYEFLSMIAMIGNECIMRLPKNVLWIILSLYGLRGLENKIRDIFLRTRFEAK